MGVLALPARSGDDGLATPAEHEGLDVFKFSWHVVCSCGWIILTCADISFLHVVFVRDAKEACPDVSSGHWNGYLHPI